MAQKISLEQKQSERLILSNEMRQSLKMLSFNATELNDYLKRVTVSNPFIQVKCQSGMTANIDFNQISDGDEENLYDHLISQVQIMSISNGEKKGLIQLIYCLDENGYLKTNVKKLAQKFNVSLSQINKWIKIIQKLDPAGVGAKNLAECLILQLSGEDSVEQSARLILKNNFQLLVSHRWMDLRRIYDLSGEDWKQIMNCLKQLTASPGESYKSLITTQYIIPDLRLSINEKGKFKLELTKANESELIFAEEDFQSLKQKADLKTREYLNAKRREFITLDNGLMQREKTLLAVANELILDQGDFLLRRAELRPLLLKDIAQKLQISISTVSRTINDKYLQTDFGVYPLKYFLSKKVSSFDSSTYYSVDEVKQRIKIIVQQENKQHPLSDSKIKEILTQSNIKISRRTIAKYRYEMRIPNSADRKIV